MCCMTRSVIDDEQNIKYDVVSSENILPLREWRNLWRSLQIWLSCSNPWDLIGIKLKVCPWLSLFTKILWMINMINIMKQTQRGCYTLKLKRDVVITWDILLHYLVAKTLVCLRGVESCHSRLVFGNVGSIRIYFLNNPISFMLQFWYAILIPSLVIFLKNSRFCCLFLHVQLHGSNLQDNNLPTHTIIKSLY
jgi:hypothetical protein